MDELANRFFTSPETFGKAMELLMHYKSEETSWESVEQFLMGLDDGDDELLEIAIEYDRLKNDSANRLAAENETLKRTIEVLHQRSLDRPPTPPENAPVADKAPLLSELLDAYLKDVSMGWDKKHFEGNERDLSPRLDLILEIIGNKKCTEVTREDVSRFKDVSIKLPSNRKKKRFSSVLCGK